MRLILNVVGVTAAIAIILMLLACSGAGTNVGAPNPNTSPPPRSPNRQNVEERAHTDVNIPEVDNTVGNPDAGDPTAKNSTEKVIESLPLVLEEWRFSEESGFVKAQGRVTNATDLPIKNLQVVVQYFTDEGAFVKSADAMVEYNPILPGQTSPFTTIDTGNPEIAKASVSFKVLFGGTVPHLNRKQAEADAYEEAQLRQAELSRKLEIERREREAVESAARMDELRKLSPAAWDKLKQELGDSLTPQKRDKIREFIQEYEGTPECEKAEMESKADGMWSLVKQYDRLKNKQKALEIAKDIVKQFPETVAGKLASKMIEATK